MSRIITFYSYKGGTGRSMALANVAWILASAGNRILTIDWDLEAPGLHRYFQPFLTDKELIGQELQGVIDMAMDFAARAATPVRKGEKRNDDWYDAYADFSKWRQKLRWPSGDAVQLGKDRTGEIDFVPAGRQGPDYAKRVNRFDWRNFYENLGGGAFFDAAKRKFDNYNYVLIDSRTGVSDTSGICTVQMPDTLVVCFTLNYQSIKGALAIAQSVREQRPQTRIFPLPTRIDGSEEKSLHRMKSYAASLFSRFLDSNIDARAYWYSMEIPYFARYAYAEKLSLFEDQSSISTSTLPAMERLSEYLTDGDVRTSEQLPDRERIAALAEFDGEAESEASWLAVPERNEEILPVRVFISYGSEDRDIAVAVQESLRRLGEMIHGTIKIFLNSDFAPGESWRETMAKELRDAEFLLVLNGGTLASSHSYTGIEVGFFNALIEEDRRRKSRRTRRIVSLNFTQSTVPALNSFLSLDVSIPAEDLRKSRDDYLQSFRRSPERDDALFRFYREIAREARPPLSVSPGPDTFAIAETLIPLRAALFDSLQTRVVSETIWNGFVNFDLSASASDQSSIAPDTKLTMNQKAWALFGVSIAAREITWGELKTAIAGEASLLSAIEQIVLDAISTSTNIETERIVRPHRGRALRLVPGRRTDRYDGTKTVQLFLLEVALEYTSGSLELMLLAIIATSVSYKNLFDRKSRFSFQSFSLARGTERIQDMTRQLIRQLRRIEENASDEDIAGPEVLLTLFENDENFLSKITDLIANWNGARWKFLASAEKILDSSLEPSEFESAHIQLMSTLHAFQQFTEQSSIIAVRALEKLEKTFGDGSLPS